MLVARTFVWIAGGVSMVVFPLMVYERTGNAGASALMVAIGAVPYLLVGLIAGALADRCSSSGLAVVCCLTAAAASVSVPAVAISGVLTTTQVFVAFALANTALVFFDAAMFAMLPAIVPAERLGRAYSMATGTNTVVRLAIPAAGGALAALVTPVYALLADSVLLLAAAGMFWRMAVPAAASADEPDSAGPSIVRDIAEGLRYVFGTSVIRTLTLLGSANSFAEGIVIGLLTPSVTELHGESAAGAAVGVAYSVVGVGALVGTGVFARMSDLPIRAVTAGGLLTAAVGIGGWIMVRHFEIALLWLAVYQAAATVVILNGITARSRNTPLRLQARVNTTARMVAWGGMPLGAFVAGALASGLGPASSVAVAPPILILAAIMAMTALRQPPVPALLSEASDE